MTIIVIMIIIAALVLVAWLYSLLRDIEVGTKLTCIIGGMIAVYVLTFIIFNISKSGIVYESVDTMKTIRTVFVLIFTVINGYAILPFTFKKLEQVHSEEITKEKFKISIFIIAFIIIALFIFESNYFGSIQQGILSMKK